MTPEKKARQKIDNLLELAGWTIQDFDELNLGAALEQFNLIYDELENK